MKSKLAIAVVVLVLCLAGGYAFFKSGQNAQAPAPAVEAAASEAPAAATPVVTTPDLAGAPPMPESAETAAPAAPEAAAPAVAGVQPGGAFSLVDKAGQPVTEKSWPGKYKLVFFGFTNCPDICPAGLTKLAALMQSYDPKGDKLVPLFITVDPARDTPAVVGEYASKFSPLIVGLTGTEEQIKAVQSTYKVYAAKRTEPAAPAHDGHEGHDGMDMGQNYGVDHSAYVYLMTPDDQLLEVFGADETAEAMVAKIKLHLQ